MTEAGIPSRTERRRHIAGLMEASGAWQVVEAHQPGTFGGKSPVATVHNGPVNWQALTSRRSGGKANYQMTFLVTNLVKREDTGDAEDQLDDLLVALLDLVEKNPKAPGLWLDLRAQGPTEPDYFIIDGQQYRGEVVRLVATV